MTFDLKKSLLVSMAALGLFAATATVNANQANAKSYARVTSNQKMTSDPATRNISFTGSNALYTKAGTLRGARVVATKTTTSLLANSSLSSDNFRAYRVATTNRGSVYYKVVSFDRQYRGWVYGGKSTASFGGGTQAYTTFTNTSLSTAQQNSLYKISNPGVANDGKTVTYKQPAWTQYKVGRQIMDSTPYANATFKITQVGTRTREGDQWVKIQATDNQYSQANGWISYSGLTLTQTPVADNAVRVNLVDANNNNNVIKTFDYAKNGAQKGSRLGTQNGSNWTLASNDQTALQNQINTALNGTGYYVGILSQSQINALAQGTFGSSVNVPVTKQSNIADNAVRINLVTPNGTLLKSVDYQKNGASRDNTVGYWNGSTWTLYSGDNTAITNLITSALSGTGYYLTNNQLTSAQQQAIAAGRFGGSVTVNVTNTPQTQFSQITPRSIGWGGPWLGSTAMTATNSPYDTKTVTINGHSYSANTIQNMGTSGESWNNLVKDIKADSSGLDKINANFKNSAMNQYIAQNNMAFGPGSGNFNSSQVMAYINANGNLKTLHSPQYPVFSPTGSGDSSSYNVSYASITYTAYSSVDGTYGNPIVVYYNYQ
ncbi:hypothetical protein ACFQ22_04640 [Lentilactobacillus raoultii]|uniref:S-layer protein n=1 Tax=Lentilactobacillus raoultii TaxID=1987503 RepID=A0ABW3PQQ1_9LACO|nr:hypothetical protein [Lentilactobacillus raoultii]